MERPNCVNEQFSKENGVIRNVCVNSTNRIVQEICNDSCCKISKSHDLSCDKLNKSLEAEECVPAYQCDKPSDYVFVDVGSNLVESIYLPEEDDDICKTSSETLFTDSKDIDYNLFKNVNIERHLKNSSKENEMHNHKLEATVFNTNDTCTGSLLTNTCLENMYGNVDNYDKKPSIDIDYLTSTVVSASRGFEKVNTYVKEEKRIEDVLVHQNRNSMSPEIKKEEIVYDEEVSVLNESIIDIELHPVNKVEESPDVSPNYSSVLDKTIKTELIVLNNSLNSDFQEVYTDFSTEVPHHCDIGDVMVFKPLKENETVPSKRESHVKLQNKVQTLSRTCSELQIKPQTNSGDNIGAAGVEECNNKLSEEEINTDVKNKNDARCQPHRKRKSKHTTETQYVCKVCYKAFSHLTLLKCHKLIHTGESQFKCDTCGKTFTQLGSLKVHKLIHTGDKPFNCNTCGKTFRHKSSLKSHKRIHTADRPYGCDTCGKAFTQLGSLKIHKRIHTGDRPYGCNSCGKAFTQLGCLNVHKRIHSGERPFECSTCSKTFIRDSDLEKHVRVHTGERPYGCNTCGKTFTQLASLKDHKRTHTGDRPFNCNTCGKTFRHVTSLKCHKRIHTGDRPYGCDACGKTFPRLGCLKIHKRMHTGERPFHCSTCSKTFVCDSDLKKHKRVHIDDRPFCCETCGKSFKQHSSLKRHKRIHTGDGPYGCDTCGEEFPHPTFLEYHKLMHTHDSPFCCKTCGKTFSRLGGLKYHKRVHTGDRPCGGDT